jgi:hypothetical protein
MANENPENPALEEEQSKAENTELESGTYEVIKGRLTRFGKDLRSKLEELNKERKEIFGAIDMDLKGNARINTENNCIARDIIAVGDYCIFGYNVQMGLRSEVKLNDVFSIYKFEDGVFHEQDFSIFGGDNKQFLTDFSNLFRYYKDAVFAKFAVEQNSPFIYMIFQLSEDINDTKTFKWEVVDGEIYYFTEPGEHRYNYPAQHEFEWKRTSRDMFRYGDHPHISILDRVFVETIGGTLTIKVEDNTADGKGIYREEVQHKDQKLEDSEVSFANLGNLIVLRIKPYLEEHRYFVFNEKLQNVQRIDALEHSGILLPGNQGLIFANGFYLQTGDYKLFDKAAIGGYKFVRRVQSPNGEDHLFVFHDPFKGTYVLLSYNVIEQNVATPINCHGYSLFKNGELCYFRSEDNPTKHHMIQIWQTPYIEGDFIPSQHTDNFLYKIGNRDIVRAMAECQELLSLLGKDETYNDLYYDLNQKARDILDSYYWIKDPKAYGLSEPLGEIQKAANAAIDEFDKVQAIKKSTRQTIQETQQKAENLFKHIGQSSFSQIDVFVEALSNLRILRGEIISLRDLRYTNIPLIESLEAKAAESMQLLSNECVQFLLKDDALQPYLDKVAEADADIKVVETAQQGKRLEERIEEIGKQLEMLIEIVSNLKIEDATQTTRIIDSITSIFSVLNQSKAALKRRMRELTSAEAIAEFAAQMKLIDQSIINYTDIADTPAKCDEYLSKLMIQVEELESKFAEFDEFILKITEKREEIYNVFETRKLSLVEAINKRTAALQSAANRILNGIRNRSKTLKTVVEINGFFASDLMIDKVRDIIKQLTELGDTNKAGDIQTQLKTVQEDALRQLRDKQDLFEGGDNVIKFGRHRFSVNNQQLDLTMVPKDDDMYYHLTGTGFFEEVTDPEFLKTKTVWSQAYPSENQKVYRSEYLAYIAMQAIEAEGLKLTSEEVLPYVQKFSSTRYNEGYSKGIHDEDAAKLLNALLFLKEHIDLLYFPSDARACAAIYWERFAEEQLKANFQKQLKSAGMILKVFPASKEFNYLLENLQEALLSFVYQTKLFPEYVVPHAANYLFQELSSRDHFIISGEAHQLKIAFKGFLDANAALKAFEHSLKELNDQPVDQFQLARKWLHAFVDQSEESSNQDYIDEVATLLILGSYKEGNVVDVKTQQAIKGMRGDHEVMEEGGAYQLDFNHFMRKMEEYTLDIVPKYENFVEMKKQLAHDFRIKLRLDEFKPRVLSSFVRNKLIDQVYLPIFGDNLAKQIGTVGEGTRTDRMGMLLLISPPGYGKTTLMEYIANRLGLIFMKINGPAIGHHVTSLDPSEAHNAGAKKELEKLNLSLEMGDNVMIYLDDIQHCNPEFLQKFISLTDAQRKIEGVYKGITKTYDLRGKRVSVVMAGNPYTESGEKFRIPDMLANRADIYNLGDIIGKTKDVFELSYIENSLTSNPVTQKLAAKSIQDLYPILRYTETGSKEGLEFEANHTSQELDEFASVLKKMLRIRDVILSVNQEYIRSAAMPDSSRTEPPFLLQGSYRNMNKLAEKVVPIMNEEEIETLILSHYKGESQTLTTGAEANMLKLKELMGVMTDEDAERWTQVKEMYVKDKLIKGDDADPMIQVVAQLSHFSDHLLNIQKVIKTGIDQGLAQPKLVQEERKPRNKGGIKFVK